MGRRELREHIFRLLFRRDFFPEEEMKEQEALYIEYLADPEQEEVDYIVQKTEKIIAMIPELDSMVNEHAVGWQTDRMGKVDLTIIRLAVYEMQYDEESPEKVAINEAVELAKHAAEAGDVVTLSPACAAFDQFKNFAVRGKTFKEIVNSLT